MSLGFLMKTFFLTTGLSLFVLSNLSLAAQASSTEQWWFQSAHQPVAEESLKAEPVPVEAVPNQPVKLSELETPTQLTPPAHPLQPQRLPLDPRQLSQEPCPACGMG